MIDILPPDDQLAKDAGGPIATPDNTPLPGGGHWTWGGPDRKWIPFEEAPAAPAVPE